MGNQTDYFNRIGYKPKWFIGDRVFGKWNKIPFVGTVGNDTPIKFNNQIHNVVVVKHKDINEYK